MRIAIEGCAHGELEKIYNTIEFLEKQHENSKKIDLLICCGDFQSTRNLEDLQTMAVPKKYQDICTFYKYYSGEKIAPVLTIFIGGNHEASNYLQELPFGGWVAPNIYYMGLAGVVNVNRIRIAGISGIYKGHDYFRGHYEYSPYSDETVRSVYHVRQLEVFKLKQLSNNIDICISHDWPRGVYNNGNHKQLIRFKPHFKDEIENNKLGSPPSAELLNILKPSYWFSAHLHCKFRALIPHEDSDKVTKFLALDKCLPKRRFLQIIEIETDSEFNDNIKFEYDLEWLTILHLTNHLLSVKKTTGYMPGPNGNERYNFTPSADEKDFIFKKFDNNLTIPQNFNRTVEPFNPNDSLKNVKQPKSQINPQTVQLCDLLSIDDPLSVAMLLEGHELNHSSVLDSSLDIDGSSFLMNSESDLNTSSEQVSLKRTSISLPQPKESRETHNESFESIDSSKEEISATSMKDSSKNLTEESFLNSSTTSEKSTNNENTSIEIDNKIKESSDPPVKKFRRRNENIYNSSENID